MLEIFKIRTTGDRIFGLDILRAIAISFVMLEHSVPYIQELLPGGIKIPIFDGVSFFFVLSGYLIGGILLKTIDRNGATFKILKNFWIRRWYRTLPAYFLVLTILILVSIFLKEDQDIPFYKFYLFIQNFNSPHPFYFFEAWSLSVEEWFYLITPSFIILCMHLFKNDLRTMVLITAIFFIVMVTCIRLYKLNTIEINSLLTWDAFLKKEVVTRLDSLMFGVIGAYINYYFSSLWSKRTVLLLVIGIVLIIAHKISFVLVDHVSLGYGSLYHGVFSFHVISIGTLLTLPFLSQYKTGKGIHYKTITHISLISYSMYLINLSLIKFIIMPIWFHPNLASPFNLWIQFAVFWLLTIAISTLMYKYFEIPAMKLRERFSTDR